MNLIKFPRLFSLSCVMVLLPTANERILISSDISKHELPFKKKVALIQARGGAHFQAGKLSKEVRKYLVQSLIYSEVFKICLLQAWKHSETLHTAPLTKTFC